MIIISHLLAIMTHPKHQNRWKVSEILQWNWFFCATLSTIGKFGFIPNYVGFSDPIQAQAHVTPSQFSPKPDFQSVTCWSQEIFGYPQFFGGWGHRLSDAGFLFESNQFKEIYWAPLLLPYKLNCILCSWSSKLHGRQILCLVWSCSSPTGLA